MQNYAEQNKIQYFADILILIGLSIVCSLIFTYIGYVLGALSINSDISVFLNKSMDFDIYSHRLAYKISSVLTQLGTFVVSVLVLCKFRSYDIPRVLSIKRPNNHTIWAFLFVFMPAVVIISTSLIFLSKNLTFLYELEKLLGIENLNKLQTQLLQMDSLNELYLNLFFIAVVPAICEEIFFRGMLQNLFSQLFKNYHLGIIMSSLVFSLIHFNLPMILPYLFLSITLGYLFQLSGSIFVNVLFHFLWNAFSIIIAYASEKNTLFKEISNDDYMPSVLLTFVSILVYISFYFIYRYKKHTIKENE